MFNTTHVPVNVYRSTDAGAPAVSYGKGAIKTILKACLVTGYGELENRKEPLGWEILFEEEYKACFRSRYDQATGWALGIDDSIFNTDRYDLKHALVYMLNKPSSVTTGAKVANLGEFSKYVFSRGNVRNEVTWTLVGCDRTFFLFVGGDLLSAALMFGEFSSLAIADGNNCFLGVTYNNSGYLGNGPDRFGMSAARDYKDDASVLLTRHSKTGWRCNYPNPITNGFTADDVYLAEALTPSGSALRGLMPGLRQIAENMPGRDVIPWFTEFENLDDTGDRYLYVAIESNSYQLVNITAWDL